MGEKFVELYNNESVWEFILVQVVTLFEFSVIVGKLLILMVNGTESLAQLLLFFTVNKPEYRPGRAPGGIFKLIGLAGNVVNGTEAKLLTGVEFQVIE